MKQSVTVGSQLLWGGRYGCNNGRYGCTIVMSYIEINKAVSQWLLTFNLCVSVTWPLTCAFHIPCTHTPEIIDMHRGVCDKRLKHLLQSSILLTISNSLVLPHLYFSILCWGFESQRLVKLQKRAVRNINRTKYNAHSEPLLKKSGLLTLKISLIFSAVNSITNLNTVFSRITLLIFSPWIIRFIIMTHEALICTNLCIRHYIPNLFNSLPVEVKIGLTHTLSLLFHMAISWLSSTDIFLNVI